MDGKDSSVKKEYVEAYKRHKGHLRNRRNTNQTVSGSDGWNDSGGGDPDLDQDAAAEEAQRSGE
jgi:hypothetical protein